MVGKLLARGMFAGLVAGLFTFGFARISGERLVDRAIAIEEHHAAMHGDAPEPELVSRDTQSGLGLLTGVVVYGTALGGLFSLVFAYAHGRAGRLGARALSVWLALAAFVTLTVVPNVKYPANPPSIGDPESIGFRTGMFFLMIVLSLAVAVFSLNMRRSLLARLGAWNASIAAALLYVVLIGVLQVALPTVNEVPADFPAALLWSFRLTAIGMQLMLWAGIGLLFGWLVERGERNGALRRSPLAPARS